MQENKRRYAAYIRAINVGGHTVKMDVLRQPFIDAGLAEVETFLASGNVIFHASVADLAALENDLTARMAAAYGFETSVFIRSLEETAHLLAYPAFSAGEITQAGAYNLAFLCREPDAAAVQRLAALTSDLDRFHVYGKHVYWLCAVKQSQSTISNAVFEKTLGMPSTIRGMNTLQRLVNKYPPD